MKGLKPSLSSSGFCFHLNIGKLYLVITFFTSALEVFFFFNSLGYKYEFCVTFFSGNSCLARVDMVALVILRMSPLSLFQAANFSFGGFLLELWLASLIYSNLDLIFLVNYCNIAYSSWQISGAFCNSSFYPYCAESQLTFTHAFPRIQPLFRSTVKNTRSCRIVLITIIHCKKWVLSAKSVLSLLSCL